MVEFAILLPIFLLIIGGIVDAGRAFFRQVELTNAAREGARAAVVASATAANIQARAQASAPGLTMTTAVTLCAGPGTNTTVTTSSAFTWFILGPAMTLVGGGNALPANLNSTAVMRCGG
jgi:Flp pilus assembly protein TadG